MNIQPQLQFSHYIYGIGTQGLSHNAQSLGLFCSASAMALLCDLKRLFTISLQISYMQTVLRLFQITYCCRLH